MKHIFLSYSHAEAEIMERVWAELKQYGLLIWTDEGIEPGTDFWKDSIEQAIEISFCLVVILSPNAKKSIWVKRELDYAKVQQVPIIPLLTIGDEGNSIPFSIIGSQFIDIRTNFDAGVNVLFKAVRKLLKQHLETYLQDYDNLFQEMLNLEIEQFKKRASKFSVFMHRLRSFDFEVQVSSLSQAEEVLAHAQRRQQQGNEIKKVFEDSELACKTAQFNLPQLNGDFIRHLDILNDLELTQAVNAKQNIREQMLEKLEGIRNSELENYPQLLHLANDMLRQLEEVIIELKAYIANRTE